MTLSYHSIIVVKSVYVSEIVPKPYYNKTIDSYLVEALVCFTPLDESTIFEQHIFYIELITFSNVQNNCRYCNTNNSF